MSVSLFLCASLSAAPLLHQSPGWQSESISEAASQAQGRQPWQALRPYRIEVEGSLKESPHGDLSMGFLALAAQSCSWPIHHLLSSSISDPCPF